MNGIKEKYDSVIGYYKDNIKVLCEIFTKATESNFPIEECRFQNFECDITESKTSYLCLVIDRRFEDEYELYEMRPYTFFNEELKEPCFAWLLNDGDFIDNIEKSVHGDCYDQYVIGFMK